MLFFVSVLLLFTAVLSQTPVHGSTSGHEKRIVDGEFIPAHHVPHHAVIRQRLYSVAINQCGAVLIAPEWLLTAEHCLVMKDINKASSPLEVFLGVSRLEQTDADPLPEAVVKRRAVRYFLGPRVKIGNRTEQSDIMLLKLDRAVPTSANIKPIELPEVGVRLTNQTAVVTGFGMKHNDDEGFPTTGGLQHIKLPILNKRDCLGMYRKKLSYDWEYEIGRLKIAPETILCAGSAEEGHNVCYGDSGGPLAVCATPLRDTSGGQLMCKDNRWQLAGVASIIHSYKHQCGEPNSPALYVNVPVFTEWIRRTMRNN